MRPPIRHFWRHNFDEATLLSQVRDLADQGDRVNLLRADRMRFTIVRNGSCYLVRDDRERAIGTFNTVQDCITAGDRYLDDAEEARAQHEADFGGDDHPRGAA